MKKIILCLLTLLFIFNLSSCDKSISTKPLEDGTYEVTYPEM